MLRLKADLKYVVDLPEYEDQNFRNNRDGDGYDDDTNVEGGIKQIILDEEGFWKPLIAALTVMTPIVKTLRMCDSDKPVIGKIYDRMFMLSDKVARMPLTWAPKCAELINERWEYLHSFMHGAGYAFDPEFYENRKDWDEAVQNGVMEICERLCLREAIRVAPDPETAWKTMTTESEEVVALSAQCDMELATFKEGLGTFTKKKTLQNAKDMQPAAWWDNYCKHLPHLSNVARSVLAQVVCSSAAERNWSIYGRIKHKGRSVLGHAKSDKLVYCHEAIHLKNRIQHAGYRSQIQSWDSDSDSNSDLSDEEQLAKFENLKV